MGNKKMSTNKKIIRSTTGRVIDSNTIKTIDAMENLETDDIVVIIHEDDYKESFKGMMKRINQMDKKVNEQNVFLNKNIKNKKKGFLGRFRRD
jgi:hypothetical protein